AELQERNFEILRRVLESPSAGAGADSRKASDFYAACMDEAGIEARALTPLTGDLTMLDAFRNPDDLPVVLAHLHQVAVTAFFRLGAQIDRDDATHLIANADQGGLALPDRDLYLQSDARSQDTRQKYAAHVEQLLKLAGADAAAAGADAKSVLAV